ncbi:uncharacterized protein LOC126426446 [Schistocerca serialis cubense]|uniref:uncharacterized protein LOC126426446 n=1 Tax=Schistocerca serialis cubense TaxID=2023355 RepID=UPI00214E4948|nr:uncharacterized protein LOC126426446 [Schistocerca serialis cubense]
MSNRKRNQVIKEFIEMYRLEPCLWQVKSKEYHDREKRGAAYERLVIKLKELEPDATKQSAVKKINNLRSNVCKEKKKRYMSMKSGALTDNIYTSKLWYLDLFDFLGDQDTPCASVSNLDDEDGYEIDEVSTHIIYNTHTLYLIKLHFVYTNGKVTFRVHIFININGKCFYCMDGFDDVAPQTPITEEPSETNESLQNSKELPISRPNFAKKEKSVELTNDVLLSVRDHFKKPSPQDDRYDLLGESIAMRMRTLEKRQRLIVEKIIDDLLYEAEMGMLNVPTSSYSSEYLTSRRPRWSSSSRRTVRSRATATVASSNPASGMDVCDVLRLVRFK